MFVRLIMIKMNNEYLIKESFRKVKEEMTEIKTHLITEDKKNVGFQSEVSRYIQSIHPIIQQIQNKNKLLEQENQELKKIMSSLAKNQTIITDKVTEIENKLSNIDTKLINKLSIVIEDIVKEELLGVKKEISLIKEDVSLPVPDTKKDTSYASLLSSLQNHKLEINKDAVLRKEGVIKILNCMMNKDCSITAQQISEETGLSPTTIKMYINDLNEINIKIDVNIKEKKHFYFLNRAYRDMKLLNHN